MNGILLAFLVIGLTSGARHNTAILDIMISDPGGQSSLDVDYLEVFARLSGFVLNCVVRDSITRTGTVIIVRSAKLCRLQSASLASPGGWMLITKTLRTTRQGQGPGRSSRVSNK